ncbi:MAG TPA: hypothetical protein VGT40_04145 [Methylomirabilota bacterium]|jgi:drug/metabolite transporter (DMT)-like permease|nr:hypothetical protein [Methylomirabilota bacterium]
MRARHRGPSESRETAGFAASCLFVVLASVRDVYLGGLFQRHSPLEVALVAFGACSAVFLPIALARNPGSIRELARWPTQVFWINATSATAWIGFFYALRTIEPLLVQVLFSGIGPLTITALDRLAVSRAPSSTLSLIERRLQVGLLVSLALAALVALAGWSGVGSQPVAAAALGVGLAVGSGISIAVNTVLCKQLHDGGVGPEALVSVRFVGAVVVAGSLLVAGVGTSSVPLSVTSSGALVAPALLLIVLPIYVNQIGVSLASPITVRVALALGPVLLFVLQLFDGRLTASLCSLAVGVLYCGLAIAATIARRQSRVVAAEDGDVTARASSPRAPDAGPLQPGRGTAPSA